MNGTAFDFTTSNANASKLKYISSILICFVLCVCVCSTSYHLLTQYHSASVVDVFDSQAQLKNAIDAALLQSESVKKELEDTKQEKYELYRRSFIREKKANELLEAKNKELEETKLKLVGADDRTAALQKELEDTKRAKDEMYRQSVRKEKELKLEIASVVNTSLNLSKFKEQELDDAKKQLNLKSIYLWTVLVIVSYVWLYGHVQQELDLGEGERFPQPLLGLVQTYQENVESVDALESADDDMLPANKEENGTKPI